MAPWHMTRVLLRDWGLGQAASEALALQILLDQGFERGDPTHPFGGPDGGKDAIVRRDGERWIMATYFPTEQRTFGRIRDKAVDDYAGVAANGAVGMAFVTNQKLTDGERKELTKLVGGPLDIFHLDRVFQILDQPRMQQVRERFLEIPMPAGTSEDDAASDVLERDLRARVRQEFAWLSTRGLPNDLREGEPRLPMEDVYVPLRVRLPSEALVEEVFEHLSYRERRILELRYGLAGGPPRTLEEVGRKFNVSRERIRQIESGALGTVHEALAADRATRQLGIEIDRDVAIALLRGRHPGAELTDVLAAGRLAVLGGPGSGKSTLTRWLVWAIAEGRDDLVGAHAHRLPLRVAASDLAKALERGVRELDALLVEQAGKFGPAVERSLRRGQAMVLLDGLDEVTDAGRQSDVDDALNRFLCDPEFEDVGVIVTSRIVGYHPVGALADLPRVMLAPLSDDDIRQFLDAWFAQTDVDHRERHVAGLMDRLGHDRRIRELAGTPLLLTVLALLQAREQRLYNERAQLYAAATETLIDSWPVQRRPDAISLDVVLEWLAPLAREVLLAPTARGMSEDDVVGLLTVSSQVLFGDAPAAARQRTRRLLHDIQGDTGIISVTGRSEDGARLWDFLHRSFAEYLVACEVAASHLTTGDVDPLAHAHEDVWREVVLMTFGEIGRRRPAAVGKLLSALTERSSTPFEPQLRRDLRLALTVLARDVPCDELACAKIVEEALRVWAESRSAPLVAAIGTLLGAVARSRHAELLARCAEGLTLSRAQRLDIGHMLDTAPSVPILRELLDEDDDVADQAAFALLTRRRNEGASEHLVRRLPALSPEDACRVAAFLDPAHGDLTLPLLEGLARGDDAETSSTAVRTIARMTAPGTDAAVESLLDLGTGREIAPLIKRYAAGPPQPCQRLAEIAERQGPRRFGALAVLRELDKPQFDRLIGGLAESPDLLTRLQALRLLGNDSQLDDLARALMERDDIIPPPLWAAGRVAAEPSHRDAAIAALTTYAIEGEEEDEAAALEVLVNVDPDTAVATLVRLIDTHGPSPHRLEMLGATIGSGGELVLRELASASDSEAAAAAVDTLLWHSDSDAALLLVDQVLAGSVSLPKALDVLLGAPTSALSAVAQQLFTRRTAEARRLGTRLLTRCDEDTIGELAPPLLDDADPTVRCAAAWALAFEGGTNGLFTLVDRVEELLADSEPIEGPPLRPRVGISAPGNRRASSCADVGFLIVEEHPTLVAI